MLEFALDGQWLAVILAPLVAAGLTRALMIPTSRWGLIAKRLISPLSSLSGSDFA